ncbi:uncharacterized protein BDR25DRAFT_15617 [Lindgomyces ingoldianus]|uniref:Uncharacterized protein n=1 Tax=Lindgomyces ingoldianus TaxID=673940 RepID=A0ACB6R2M2_9PLEO|nr:uncharacterized protein BDR25DRAFT_15617 [Lindgomyces ingoldianus]KAF2472582.1 hypothetical protein BDR25DRAFT_15617 [Lindgomyces ingoldianus]
MSSSTSSVLPVATGDALMEVPLRAPPLGVVSNFSNPSFMGTPVLVTAGICLPLILAFTAVRIYAKLAILKKWKLEDYVYCISCPVVIALISFEISIVLTKPNGYHAWDVNSSAMDKSSALHLLVFSISLGPVLWLLKLTLFCSILSAFGSVRWLKNCAYIGLITTGLFFMAYSIIVAVSCGPRPSTDTESYLNGFNRGQCSSATGVNAIASILLGIVNLASDVYLLIIPLPSVISLNIPLKQKIGVFAIVCSGLTMCVCSLLGLIYRIMSWRSPDFTGTQIPLYVVFVAELSLGLMIPCMPSLFTVYRHFTVPDINDTATIATPNMRGFSSLSSPKTESRATWRKTHLSIEEIPYRKPSSEWERRPIHDHRMKALPPTPLLLNPASVPPSPKTPKTPASFRSMHLPIMFQTTSK